MIYLIKKFKYSKGPNGSDRYCYEINNRLYWLYDAVGVFWFDPTQPTQSHHPECYDELMVVELRSLDKLKTLEIVNIIKRF